MSATPVFSSADPNGPAARLLRDLSERMSFWLKFLGFFAIVAGALMAMTIIGMIVAWIPLWMGVALYRGGEEAARVARGGGDGPLLNLMGHLRTSLSLAGAALIFALVFAVMALLFTAAFLGGAGENLTTTILHYFTTG